MNRGGHLENPPEGDVTRQTVSSGVVAIGSNIAQMVIGISTTLVLVRLIEPEDYGVYWMGGAALLLSVAVRDLGIGVAVVNAKALTYDRASGMFWTAAGASLAVAVVLAALGPVLASIFGEPALVLLLPALAAGSLLSGLGAVHDGLLKRRLRFAAVACRDVGGMLAGSIAGIATAAAGLGFWALAAQQVTLAAAGLLILLAACPWVPAGLGALRRTLAEGAERSHLWHGTRISATRLINTVGITADRFLVGAVAGDRSLGLYNQSYQWAEFPTRQVYQPLMGVVVSAFSRQQEIEAVRYRRAFRQVLLVLYGVTIPMLVYGAIRGNLVIPVLLGDKWLEAAPLFRVLCIGFAFRLLVQACKWLYLGESRSADNLRWASVMTPVLVTAAGAGVAFGAMGVAIGIAAVYVLAAPITVWYATRRSRVEPMDLLAPGARPLLGSGLGITTVIGLSAVLPSDTPDVAQLVVEVASFILAGSAAWVLPGRSRDELLVCVRQLAARFDRGPATVAQPDPMPASDADPERTQEAKP